MRQSYTRLYVTVTHTARRRSWIRPDRLKHAEAEPSPRDDEPSRPCRYCAGQGDHGRGKMVLTGRTRRLRVIEMLRMPWEHFAQPRPGPIVTLGKHVAEVQPGTAPRTVASAQEEEEEEEEVKAEARWDANPRPASAFW